MIQMIHHNFAVAHAVAERTASASRLACPTSLAPFSSVLPHHAGAMNPSWPCFLALGQWRVHAYPPPVVLAVRAPRAWDGCLAVKVYRPSFLVIADTLLLPILSSMPRASKSR